MRGESREIDGHLGGIFLRDTTSGKTTVRALSDVLKDLEGSWRDTHGVSE